MTLQENSRGAEEEYQVLPQDGSYDLPPYLQKRRRNRICQTTWPIYSVLGGLCLLLLLVGAGFVLWPTSPEVEVKKWKLNGINIESSKQEGSIIPVVQLNVSLDLLLEIENPNYAGVVYDSLTVRVLYKGSEIGEVESEGGSVSARSTGNVTATVNLEGREILDNVKDLLIDVANRELPLTTYTTINGAVQLLFLKPHIEVTVACDIVVDPKDKEVLSQDCDLDLLSEGGASGRW